MTLSKGQQGLLIFVVVILALVGIGVGIYFGVTSGNNNKPPSSSTGPACNKNSTPTCYKYTFDDSDDTVQQNTKPCDSNGKCPDDTYSPANYKGCWDAGGNPYQSTQSSGIGSYTSCLSKLVSMDGSLIPPQSQSDNPDAKNLSYYPYIYISTCSKDSTGCHCGVATAETTSERTRSVVEADDYDPTQYQCGMNSLFYEDGDTSKTLISGGDFANATYANPYYSVSDGDE